ncbi:helix-turn-helix protein [Actinomycetospora succinea]|uniref:Helix-turn-helix protein n=1 Tax=Actinomycetospora succinea TaxID=663603 RepID=A0A4V3DA77_9PSEU|nr:helix-turn-helix transcriptional regulator [Actinomycetospora succinea]TDQ60828.1 helix-turn-helix protein [Actinomycetospora succinea]
MVVPGGAWEDHRRALGGFIRSQRKLARLSLRQLSALSNISNPYLSQIERGLHEPSVRVLHAIAEALDISAETLLLQAGLVREHAGDAPAEAAGSGDGSTERAIRADPRLSDAQKEALISVYRSYTAGSPAPGGAR